MKKLSYQDVEIQIEDGKYVRIALILRAEPIPLVSQNLYNFCKRFESHFSTDLENFKGYVTKFEEQTPNLIGEIFS